MKHFLWCLLAFLCCGIEGWGACSNNTVGSFTCIQSNQATGTSVAFPSNEGSGHLLIAFYDVNDNTVAPTISDTAGNSWTSIGAIGSSARGGNLWYACNSVSGANTVTIASSGAGYNDLTILEYSGNTTTACLDNSGTAVNSVNSIPNFSATSGDLLIGCAFANGGAAGTGFTAREARDSFAICEDQSLSGSTASVLFTTTNGNDIGFGAAFKASGGGSTPTGSTLVGPSAVLGPSKVQ